MPITTTEIITVYVDKKGKESTETTTVRRIEEKPPVRLRSTSSTRLADRLRARHLREHVTMAACYVTVAAGLCTYVVLQRLSRIEAIVRRQQ